MSELRHNPITRQWVIVAENRGARPQDLVVQQIVQDTGHCPFCEGHEESTPGEVMALRRSESQPNQPGWHVRVVPNKYPAVEAVLATTTTEPPNPSPLSATADARPRGEGVRVPSIGVHEIIIESPRHLTSVAQLSDGHFADVIDVYRQRLTELRRGGQFSDAVLFKNSGAGGGATLAHLHSQLVALRHVGGESIGRLAAVGEGISVQHSREPIFADRTPTFRELTQQFGICPLCIATKDQSSGHGHSFVLRSENFTVFCPFASRFAYEMWVVPREHMPRFEDTKPEILPELARLLRAVLVKLEATVKSSAYNYIIHTAPFDTAGANHYHWHIEILPRLSNLAGFELGTGCFINTVSPERAAAALREA